jgi:hypothetical protein
MLLGRSRAPRARDHRRRKGADNSGGHNNREKSPFLMPMHTIIGGIEVEHHVSKWYRVGGKELVDKNFGGAE